MNSPQIFEPIDHYQLTRHRYQIEKENGYRGLAGRYCSIVVIHS